MAFETRYCSNCATELQWITQAEDGGDVSRLRCTACGFTHWGNPTPVLAAVVEADDGRVLLARNAQWQEGVFGLITGFMEAGESPEAGICREVLEETGLKVKALRLLCCSEFLRMNQVLIAYHVRVEGKAEDVRLSPELLEYRWQTAEERRILRVSQDASLNALACSQTGLPSGCWLIQPRIPLRKSYRAYQQRCDLQGAMGAGNCVFTSAEGCRCRTLSHTR